MSPIEGLPGLAEAMVTAFDGQDIAATTEAGESRFLKLKGHIEGSDQARTLVWRIASAKGKTIGEIRLPLPPGRYDRADGGVLAAASAPAVAALLRGRDSGVGDLAVRTQVRLHPVSVPPGFDGASLTHAMARALARQGLAVDGPAPAFDIEGKLRITPGANDRDLVEVEWTVRDTAGKELGTVSQGSPVPRETLLGQVAILSRQIADAGAEGVAEVVRKSSRGH